MAKRRDKEGDGRAGAEMAALREEIERLKEAIEQAAKAEGGEALRAAGEAARGLAARAAALVDELGIDAGSAAAAAGESRRHLEEAVRERPLLAIAMAAAAGFLLAAVLRR